MTRPEMLKMAKEYGIAGAFKMKNPELELALKDAGYVEQEVEKPALEEIAKVAEEVIQEVEKPKEVPKFAKTLFKAFMPDNIEGYQFNPFLLVDNNEYRLDKKGERIRVIDFLKQSAWYGRRFSEVTGPTVQPNATKKVSSDTFYTESELREFANLYNIDISGLQSIEDIYIRVFGGEKLAQV